MRRLEQGWLLLEWIGATCLVVLCAWGAEPFVRAVLEPALLAHMTVVQRSVVSMLLLLAWGFLLLPASVLVEEVGRSAVAHGLRWTGVDLALTAHVLRVGLPDERILRNVARRVCAAPSLRVLQQLPVPLWLKTELPAYAAVGLRLEAALQALPPHRVAGAPVPTVVSAALRSSDRVVRERAIRWMGTGPSAAPAAPEPPFVTR